MEDGDGKTGLSSKDIFLKGTIIALIVTIPSLSAFVISWKISDELVQAAIIGGVVHFIAMIFSFKISKKLFVKNA